MSKDRRQASDRGSLAKKKQGIATSGTRDLTDASHDASRPWTTLDRIVPIHRNMSFDRNRIHVGEHRQEVFRLS